MDERARALLIATAGGHLTQLNALAPRLGIDPGTALWVTTDTPQSRSVLAGREVVWAGYGAPRDLRALARHLRLAVRSLRGAHLSVAVSTGASLAPPFLLAARLRGIPCHYIESATRVTGPSFAGGLVRRIPGVRLYAQYTSWADGRWHYGGSIFDGFEVIETGRPRAIERAVVTVGSARGFAFNRLVQAARRVLPETCSVTWQVLDADATGLRGRVETELSAVELRRAIEAADVVISHAGTGSAITALQLGHCPVLVPRSSAHGEHVDEHQHQIATMLAERDLAIVRTPDELSIDDLRTAAGRVAREVPGPAFRLAS